MACSSNVELSVKQNECTAEKIADSAFMVTIIIQQVYMHTFKELGLTRLPLQILPSLTVYCQNKGLRPPVQAISGTFVESAQIKRKGRPSSASCFLIILTLYLCKLTLDFLRHEISSPHHSDGINQHFTYAYILLYPVSY